MRMTSGAFPLGGSASTYAPRCSPDAGAYFSRSRVGSACRDRNRATGSWRRGISQRHASATSLASAGRMSTRPGTARSEAICSTGWWVGPSSPTPMESWVKMWTTGSSISADKRIAPRWKSEKMRNPA